jgi:hypothetical protein
VRNSARIEQAFASYKGARGAEIRVLVDNLTTAADAAAPMMSRVAIDNVVDDIVAALASGAARDPYPQLVLLSGRLQRLLVETAGVGRG